MGDRNFAAGKGEMMRQGRQGRREGQEAARKDAHDARGERKNTGPYETLLNFASVSWVKKCNCAYGTMLYYAVESHGEVISVR